MDYKRVEIDINNAIDLLHLYLDRLEALSKGDNRQRLAKTANIMSAKSIGLAKQAQRVAKQYPGLT